MSDGKDDTEAGNPIPNIRTTLGRGRLDPTYDLTCIHADLSWNRFEPGSQDRTTRLPS
ncbi:hypothetical protein AVEN_117106-1 [Araneus ventricosus]|uniref:Uncharacterized protein n=1 Tax=Araneus ventricosus TaxID=182803 RepID=A0A4Y2NXR8_ARAVE|nr:hypothetical protein AVEN_117106-1 [Araneus ventricosus]